MFIYLLHLTQLCFSTKEKHNFARSFLKGAGVMICIDKNLHSLVSSASNIGKSAKLAFWKKPTTRSKIQL